MKKAGVFVHTSRSCVLLIGFINHADGQRVDSCKADPSIVTLTPSTLRFCLGETVLSEATLLPQVSGRLPFALSVKDGEVSYVLGFAPDPNFGERLTYANARRAIESVSTGERLLDSLATFYGASAEWSKCEDDMEGLAIHACRTIAHKNVEGATVTTTIGHFLVPGGRRFVLLKRELAPR